jgi:hypothetical protein
LDNRPRLKSGIVWVSYATLAFSPNLWAILTYTVLCSLFYYGNLTSIEPIIQLYRLVFGFHPVGVYALLPAGFTNYPQAVAESILISISPNLEIGSLLFWVALPTISGLSIYKLTVSGKHLDAAAVNGTARRFRPFVKVTKISLLLYFALFLTASACTGYGLFDSPTRSPTIQFTEIGIGADCVSVVVTRANGTVERSPPCQSSGSSEPSVVPSRCALPNMGISSCVLLFDKSHL